MYNIILYIILLSHKVYGIISEQKDFCYLNIQHIYVVYLPWIIIFYLSSTQLAAALITPEQIARHTQQPTQENKLRYVIKITENQIQRCSG